MPYAWGSKTALAEVLGRLPSGAPEAELWMGAHPSAPSLVVDATENASDLAELIATDPSTFLGRRVAEEFGQLPFLFKVLSAEQPLSLQAHPSMEQAREGFRREERAGIARDARERIYKDPLHKPELIHALTPFVALSGFRPPHEALAIVAAFGVPDGKDQLSLACEAWRSSPAVGLEGYFRELFSLDREVLRRAIVRVREKAEALISEATGASRVAPWLLRLIDSYPDDPGILAALLLNLVELAPGEAMFLPAGNLHAYLRGTGLELMASSDNVLRGGLTPKHVDVSELCNILEFDSYVPPHLTGEPSEAGTVRYRTPALEFELSVTTPGEGISLRTEGPEVWLALEGSVTVSCPEVPGSPSTWKRGTQAFVSAGQRAEIGGNGRLFRARVPDGT